MFKKNVNGWRFVALLALEKVKKVMVAEKKDVESTFYTVEDVEKHREYEVCWIILGEKGERRVYDITSFLDDHPGS